MSSRLTVEKLIKEGLNYCCLYAFFKLFRKTGLIADRLGVTQRAVQYQKRRFRDGDLKCEKCPRCLKGKLF